METDRWIGLLTLLFCCVLLFLWIPFDVDSGIIEKVRRQVRLGDAFAPSLAALLIGLGGLLLLLQRSDKTNDHQAPSAALSESNPHTDPTTNSTTTNQSERSLQSRDFGHACIVLLLVSCALILMRYAGPFVLQLIQGNEAEYRLLRDTVPWKYGGFSLGGLVLIASLISYIEGRIRPLYCLLAVVVIVLLIGFYDLPFDDLLLPPNGDV